ncbi:MAG: ATP cone domain-containing protein, partial [Arcobacteraceae bacterium]
MQFIYKRDGSKEEFRPFKIEDAIKKGFASVAVRYDEQIFRQVLQITINNDLKTVEDIQDVIEKKLFEAKYFNVAKSFITYRFLHKMQRE